MYGKEALRLFVPCKSEQDINACKTEDSNGSDDGEEEEERQDAMFVLPLHQRLQLIKIR